MRNTSCIWYVMSAQTSLFPTNRTVEFTVPTCFGYGPGIVVGIATGYALDGPGIESRWGEIFRTCPDRPWGTHPASCTMGTGSFPGVKSGRGVTLTSHPIIVSWS